MLGAVLNGEIANEKHRNVKTTMRTLAQVESQNEKAECRLVPPSWEHALLGFPPLPVSLNDLENAAGVDLGVPNNLERVGTLSNTESMNNED